MRMVCRTLVKASKALAPRLFFEQWESLRAITAGRRSRSARLLGFHIILSEKTQQPAAIMLRSDSVEQALIVGITQDAITKQPGQVVIQSYCLLAVILRFH